MDDDAAAVIRQAERIIYQAGWHVLEEVALVCLAGPRGLRWARLEPRSDVIQLVTFDGEHLGHVRRDSASAPPGTWVAVRLLAGRAIGCYPTTRDAAQALAAACGKEIAQHG